MGYSNRNFTLVEGLRVKACCCDSFTRVTLCCCLHVATGAQCAPGITTVAQVPTLCHTHWLGPAVLGGSLLFCTDSLTANLSYPFTQMATPVLPVQVLSSQLMAVSLGHPLTLSRCAS